MEFKKQFKSKTATEWQNRVGMTAKKGKYVWLERDYADDEEKEEGSSKTKEPKETEKIPDSTLHKDLQVRLFTYPTPKLTRVRCSAVLSSQIGTQKVFLYPC